MFISESSTWTYLRTGETEPRIYRSCRKCGLWFLFRPDKTLPSIHRGSTDMDLTVRELECGPLTPEQHRMYDTHKNRKTNDRQHAA